MKKSVKTSALLLSLMMVMSSVACTAKTALDTNETTESTAVSVDPSFSIDMTDYSFETVYGSQFNAYLDHQYYINDEEIPVYESNYYFVDAFMKLTEYAQYGIYPMTDEGFLDLSATIEPSEDGTTDYQTYGDFLVDYAERMIASTAAIVKMSEAEGLTLTDETYAAIDTLMDQMYTEYAAPLGMTLDEYIQFYYGPNCDEADFRVILEHFYLAEVYTQNFMDNFDYGDEDFSVPLINYTVFAAAEDEIDAPLVNFTLYYADSTSETYEADLADAEAAANALVESSTTIDELKSNAVTDYSTGVAVNTGDMAITADFEVPEMTSWATDANRQIGDIEAIYAEGYGYIVLGYLGVQGEISEAAANDLYNQATDLETLASLGQELYTSGKCLESGQIEVPRGQMVPAFEDWAYDESRTEGDIEIIYAEQFGYFVVGYAGLSEDTAAKEEFAVAAMSEYVDGKLETDFNVYTNDEFVPADEVVLDGTANDTGVVTPEDLAEGEEKSTDKSDVLKAILLTVGIMGGVSVIAVLANKYAKKDKSSDMADNKEADKED